MFEKIILARQYGKFDGFLGVKPYLLQYITNTRYIFIEMIFLQFNDRHWILLLAPLRLS